MDGWDGDKGEMLVLTEDQARSHRRRRAVDRRVRRTWSFGTEDIKNWAKDPMSKVPDCVGATVKNPFRSEKLVQ